MPTPGEQKALLFLGAVALLGGAVRLLGGDPPVPPTASESAGLNSQLASTDSATAARAAAKKSSGRKGPKPKKRPSSRQQRDSSGTSHLRISPIDVDRATLEELTSLPGVGPALAGRIVAERNAGGAFGSLEALDVVPGVGPALIKRLGPHVTFSGPRRPSTATASGGGVRASGRVVGLIGGRP